MAHDGAPELLLDVFRAAALSVTKLYKSSVAAQAKVRHEGYQDCLDDLLQFLDKEHLGLGDGEGWKVRAWANERLEFRDGSPPIMESDEDGDKAERAASPENTRTIPAMTATPTHNAGNPQPPLQPTPVRPETQPTTTDAEMGADDTPMVQEVTVSEPIASVPTQETFSFRSAIPYPSDNQNPLNFSSLRLSDGQAHDTSPSHRTTSCGRPTRTGRIHRTSGGRTGSRTNTTTLGRGAGQKRRVDYEELFGLGNLGQHKDGFGGTGDKKRRHN